MAAGVAPSVEFLSVNSRLWVPSSEPLRPAGVRHTCLPSPGERIRSSWSSSTLCTTQELCGLPEILFQGGGEWDGEKEQQCSGNYFKK